MGALPCLTCAFQFMPLAQMLPEFLVGVLSIREVHRIVAMKHGCCLMSGHFHDHGWSGSCLPHIGVEGVAQIVKPEVYDPGFLTGISEAGLYGANRLAFVSEDPVMS
jgi:hypothetical protein